MCETSLREQAGFVFAAFLIIKKPVIKTGFGVGEELDRDASQCSGEGTF